MKYVATGVRLWVPFAAAALGGTCGLVACVGSEPLVTPASDVDAGSDSAVTDSGSRQDSPVENEPSEAGTDASADVDAALAKKRTFVTTAVTDGNFPGLKGADDFCKAAATQATTGGTFMAFLSIPGANAIDRLIGEGPWYSMDTKTLLFTGKTAGAHPISGLGPAAPIDQNEHGQKFTSADTWYWTGTSAGGAVSTSHCDLWTNDQTGAGFAAGTVGRADRNDKDWTAFQTVTCYSALHVLCFEN